MAKNWYLDNKGTLEDFRLPLQHFLFREHFGYNVSPRTRVHDLVSPRIAEVACGTCVWQLQVANELGPNARIDGFDISLDLCPPPGSLPANVTVTKWDVLQPLPAEFEGQYDLVHVRLLMAGLPKAADIGEVMQNFMKMLKPGGWLQWEEPTGTTFAYDQNREPSASARADIEKISERSLAVMSARCFAALITELPLLFEKNGFVGVQSDGLRPVDAAWLKTWHRLTMMTLEAIARVLEKAGDVSYWELLHRIDAASATDEGTYLYYQPGSTIGQKPTE